MFKYFGYGTFVHVISGFSLMSLFKHCRQENADLHVYVC